MKEPARSLRADDAMRAIAALALVMIVICSRSATGQGFSDGDGFVRDTECVACHEDAASAWMTSHHARSMQVANHRTVLGDFDETTFEDAGVTTRFQKKDGRYVIHTEGFDGEPAELEVRYTFGVSPLQQYLVEAPGGWLQAFTVAWDTAENRWFSLYPGERYSLEDALRWTGRYQSWNAMCAECHSTNLEKNYEPERDTYQTTWSEINVGCQACHGPGRVHVEWARDHSSDTAHDGDNRGLVVDYAAGSAGYEVDQCARCHSRRDRVGDEDRHGRALLDDFVPQTLRNGLYHADGQIDGEVYVYGSFVQSKMYAAGVRCTDCHHPHSGAVTTLDNSLCTRCHGERPDPRFPMLKSAVYDSPSHHFHAVDSAGAACVACHMPGKVFMTIDYRRDHGFRIPRPRETALYGVPNACNECHSDKDAEWAAGAIEAHFGHASSRHGFAATLHAARTGGPNASERLIELVADRSQPAMARSTALELLGPYGAVGGKVVARSLSDPSPLVRVGALRALEHYPAQVIVAGAVPRLGDEVRAVRIEAARILAGFPTDALDPSIQKSLATALSEYEAAVLARSDLPSGRAALAVLAEQRGDPVTAERQYRTALTMDVHYLPARFNLANLLSRLGRRAEAEKTIRDGLALYPDEGELHYSLGLLLAESGNKRGSAEALTRAAELLPGRARVRYNQGLALRALGLWERAEKALLNAQALDPVDVDTVRALIIHYTDRQQWEDASRYAKQLVRLDPESSQARLMLQRIEIMSEFGASQ